MDVEELSMIGPVVDLGSVNAIHRKRLLAFLNHFIIQSASFLNKISSVCESKLLRVDLHLQKLEAALILLESKLSSIPGLEIVANVASSPVESVPDAPKDTSIENKVQEEKIEEPIAAVTDAPEPLTEEYQVYVKMLHVGVPLPAVKIKMSIAGVPPHVQDLISSAMK